MNLAEVFDAALPELPVRSLRKGYPKLHPDIVLREHVEEGEPIYMGHIPGQENVYRFNEAQLRLIKLFDGRRSYEQISQLCQDELRIALTADQVRQFAAELDDIGVWYKSRQQRNLALAAKLREERRNLRKLKWKYGDVSRMTFSAWDPDAYLTRLHARIGAVVYSRWFFLANLVLLLFAAYIFVDRWNQIGSDTVAYYTFTGKSFSDIAEFWLLFLVIGFFHESAHGLTCKHYGGGAHKMGFMLIYLAPAFFVDVTEAWVYARRRQRLAVVMAGIWIELVFCWIATVIWWGTVPGTFAHDFSYKIMLITGVAVVLMNLNPLMKLDGYYALGEIVGIGDLKERSTEYVGNCIRRYLFGMPVDVEWLPRRRRILFVSYSMLSGLYCYAVLFAVIRFAYNVLHSFSPEWAFVPAAALAYRIFRSRIRNLTKFTKAVYLDKRERVRRSFTRPRLAILAALLLIVLFVPGWRESRHARFILEPREAAMVHSTVAGVVHSIYVDEGQFVRAGERLASLRSLELETASAKSTSDFEVASARAVQAQLRSSDYGRALQQREDLQRRRHIVDEQTGNLEVVSPISGVIVTPRVRDHLGSYLPAGTPLAEVVDISTMRARLYLPEPEMAGLRVGAPVRLLLDSSPQSLSGEVATIAPGASATPAGLTATSAYKGMQAPPFYAVIVVLSNEAAALKPGMTGDAKVLIGRRSLAGFAGEAVYHFVRRRFW